MAYAHSRGILHRDLKPQNVMLGKYDETLVVDWGLAKPFERDEAAGGAAEEALTPSSGSPTPTVGVVGTLAYMSPEQAAERPAEVGAASDLFSLGAVLYAILTGEVPYRSRGDDEVLEKVRCCEFPAPRQIKPAAPRALEAICLKAMAARPADRYATALDLAADVKRCLADEPVMAWPEPMALRARRWMRRHRTLVTSTAPVLVFSVVGLAGFAMVLAGKNTELAERSRALDIKNTELVSTNQEVNRQRQRAEEREGLAIDAVKKFRDAVQGKAQLKNRPELDALRKALLTEPMEFFRTLRDQLQADRDTRPEALAKLAQASFDLAETTAEIGSIPDAIQSHCQALAIRERLARDNPSVAEYQRDLASSHNNLGNMLTNTGHRAEAIESLQRALEIDERLARDNPADSLFQSDLAKVHNNIGRLLNLTGRPVEALESFLRALEIEERVARDTPAVTDYQRVLAMGHHNVGLLQHFTAHPAEALESCRRAVVIQDRRVRDNPATTRFQSDLAMSHNNIGELLRDIGHPAVALESYHRALKIRERLARDNPSDHSSQSYLGATLQNIAEIEMRQRH